MVFSNTVVPVFMLRWPIFFNSSIYIYMSIYRSILCRSVWQNYSTNRDDRPLIRKEILLLLFRYQSCVENYSLQVLTLHCSLGLYAFYFKRIQFLYILYVSFKRIHIYRVPFATQSVSIKPINVNQQPINIILTDNMSCTD